MGVFRSLGNSELDKLDQLVLINTAMLFFYSMEDEKKAFYYKSNLERLEKKIDYIIEMLENEH